MYVNILRYACYHYFLLLTPFISPVFTALMLPPNAIQPTTTNQPDTTYSPTLEVAGAENTDICVGTEYEPNWAGEINENDCSAAFRAVRDYYSHLGSHIYTFWSLKFGPPSGTSSMNTMILPIERVSGKSL